MVCPVSPALLTAALALTVAQGGDIVLEFERLDAQERLNDALEEHFDQVCAALKGGRRTLGEPLVPPRVALPVADLVQVVNCSLRALRLDAPRKDGARPVRMLWELDGRTASGHYVTVRGETPGAVSRAGKRWRLSELDTQGHERIEVPARRFHERAQAWGLVLPERPGTRDATDSVTGGLSARDLDGDGLLDVVAIDGDKAWLFHGKPGRRFAPPELLAQAPKGVIFTSAALGDVDADGDVDLALTSFPDVPVRLYRNEKGKLVEVAAVSKGGAHQSAAFSDLDGDGKLDLYVLAYPSADRVPSSFIEAGNGAAPEVWLGNGDFSFRALPFPPGVAKKRWSLAAVAADVLGAGGLQLYLANDFGSNDLYAFLPDGGVTEDAPARHLDDPGNGMSADVGDVDRDGRLDIYVANMFSKAGTRVIAGSKVKGKRRAVLEKFAQGNTLYLAQADGGFVEQGKALGVNRGLWAFGSLLADVDDDGHLEALVANGFVSHPKRKDL